MSIIKIKLLFRNLRRNILHSVINIVGFSIGIAAFIAIILYAQFHFSFDKIHSKSNDIYQLHLGDYGGIPAPIINQIKDKFPEIENSVRYTDWYGGGREGYFVINDDKYKSTNLLLPIMVSLNFSILK